MTLLNDIQQKQLDEFTTAADRFLGLIETLDDQELDQRVEADGWTIRQIVHHVSDDGDVWEFQMKRALATPGTSLRFEGFPGNEPWANALHFGERAVKPDLALIRAHNRAMAALAADFPDAWQNSICPCDECGNPTGSISVTEMIAFLTEHLQEHAATVENILKKGKNQ